MLRAQRLRVQISLAGFTIECAKTALLFRGLDALRGDRHAKLASQVQDGFHDLRVCQFVAGATDERLIDLERLHRELIEIGERRVSGSEVVDMDRNAAFAQLNEDRLQTGEVFHQQTLG